MGRRSLLLVLLAAAGAGALLCVSLPGWGIGAPALAFSAEEPSDPALVACAPAARLQGRGGPGAVGSADGEPDETCPFDPQAVVLQVRLLGYECGGRHSESVWLSNVPRNPAWYTTRDGTREAWFDVTALFTQAHARWVGIRARHRDYVAEDRVFWLPEAPPASRRLETSFRMQRARAVLGRVVDAAGEAVRNAAVALYRLEVESSLEACDAVATDAEGRFRLRTVERGSYLVLATTHKDAWPAVAGYFRDEDPVPLPGTCRLEVEQAVTTLPRDLVLRAPVAIEGRVTIRGRPCLTTCATVWARRPTESTEIKLWTDSYALWLWDGCRARPRTMSGDLHGSSFRVSGLAPGPHQLGFWGGSGEPTDPDLADVPPVHLDAPVADVAIDLDALLVEVCLRDEDGPLQSARVEILRDGKEVHEIRDSLRRGWCYLTPGLTYVLRVRAPGHEDTEIEQTLPLGVDAFTWEVRVPRVEAVRSVRTGSVAARVRAGGRGIDRLSVDLTSAEAGRRWQRSSEQGRVVFEDLAPGWWELRVGGFDASDLAESEHSPYLLPGGKSVFVSTGVRTKIDVDLDVGGLLEIAVRDGFGRCVPAEAEVLDVSGRVVCDSFLACDLRMFYGWCIWESGLCHGTPSVTWQALPPGRYEVCVRPDGAPPRRVFVEVTAGCTTSVEIDLESHDSEK